MRWQAGEFQEFLDWCLAHERDLQEFEAALRSVPLGGEWEALGGALLQDFEFNTGATAHNHVPGQPIQYDTIDPVKEQLRAAKKRMVEAEVARRATQRPAT